MDKVRFGRALGYGARHAARAMMSAAEAAATPSNSPVPAPPRQAAPPSANSKASATVSTQARSSAARATQVKQVASRSFLTPIKQFSGTVFQQVLGTMFGLFALIMGQTVWRLRAAFAGPHNTPEAHRLYLATVMFLLFAWFTVSSFVRAHQRGKRR